MAFHKNAVFSKREQLLALYARSLSHPARIAILRILAGKKECVCGQIVAMLPLAQSTVSQHLKELVNAGLVISVPEGTTSVFRINWKTMEKFQSEFSFLHGELKSKSEKGSSGINILTL